MALITAAVTAVAAAATSIASVGVAASTAAIAAAAVNVGTLVGTIGLGMSVVGMATGNKTLTKIGGYLGMAGGAMGLAGGLAGGTAQAMKNISNAWDDGVGSLFSSTQEVGKAGLQQEALGRGIVAGTNPDAAAHYASTGQTVAEQGVAAGAANPASTATLPSPDLNTEQMSRFVTPETIEASQRAQYTKAVANAVPDYTSTGAALPQTPTPGAALSQTTAQAMKPAVETGMQAAGQPAGRQDPKGFFASMPDWAKAQMAISGVQGLSGMMGGWFEGATAEEKLALEREALEWRKQYEGKDQAFNQKNASYAPRVTFGGGALSKPANA